MPSNSVTWDKLPKDCLPDASIPPCNNCNLVPLLSVPQFLCKCVFCKRCYAAFGRRVARSLGAGAATYCPFCQKVKHSPDLEGGLQELEPRRLLIVKCPNGLSTGATLSPGCTWVGRWGALEAHLESECLSVPSIEPSLLAKSSVASPERRRRGSGVALRGSVRTNDSSISITHHLPHTHSRGRSPGDSSGDDVPARPSSVSRPPRRSRPSWRGPRHSSGLDSPRPPSIEAATGGATGSARAELLSESFASASSALSPARLQKVVFVDSSAERSEGKETHFTRLADALDSVLPGWTVSVAGTHRLPVGYLLRHNSLLVTSTDPQSPATVVLSCGYDEPGLLLSPDPVEAGAAVLGAEVDSALSVSLPLNTSSVGNPRGLTLCDLHVKVEALHDSSGHAAGRPLAPAVALHVAASAPEALPNLFLKRVTFSGAAALHSKAAVHITSVEGMDQWILPAIQRVSETVGAGALTDHPGDSASASGDALSSTAALVKPLAADADEFAMKAIDEVLPSAIVLLDSCRFEDVGVEVSAVGGGIALSDCTFVGPSKSKCDESGCGGLAIRNGSVVAVSGCAFHTVSGVAITVESTVTSAIVGCRVSDPHTTAVVVENSAPLLAGLHVSGTVTPASEALDATFPVIGCYLSRGAQPLIVACIVRDLSGTGVVARGESCRPIVRQLTVERCGALAGDAGGVDIRDSASGNWRHVVCSGNYCRAAVVLQRRVHPTLEAWEFLKNFGCGLVVESEAAGRLVNCRFGGNGTACLDGKAAGVGSPMDLYAILIADHSTTEFMHCDIQGSVGGRSRYLCLGAVCCHQGAAATFTKCRFSVDVAYTSMRCPAVVSCKSGDKSTFRDCTFTGSATAPDVVAFAVSDNASSKLTSSRLVGFKQCSVSVFNGGEADVSVCTVSGFEGHAFHADSGGSLTLTDCDIQSPCSHKDVDPAVDISVLVGSNCHLTATRTNITGSPGISVLVERGGSAEFHTIAISNCSGSGFVACGAASKIAIIEGTLAYTHLHGLVAVQGGSISAVSLDISQNTGTSVIVGAAEESETLNLPRANGAGSPVPSKITLTSCSIVHGTGKCISIGSFGCSTLHKCKLRHHRQAMICVSGKSASVDVEDTLIADGSDVGLLAINGGIASAKGCRIARQLGISVEAFLGGRIHLYQCSLKGLLQGTASPSEVNRVSKSNIGILAHRSGVVQVKECEATRFATATMEVSTGGNASVCNSIFNAGKCAVFAHDGGSVEILDSEISGHTQAQVVITSGAHGRLLHSHISNGGEAGLYVCGGAAMATVEDCDFTSNAGVFTDSTARKVNGDASKNKVTQANIEGRAQIIIDSAHDVRLVDCGIIDGFANGMVIGNGSRASVEHCTIERHGGAGIDITDASHPSIIGCVIKASIGPGIVSRRSAAGLFRGNDLRNNEGGPCVAAKGCAPIMCEGNRLE